MTSCLNRSEHGAQSAGAFSLAVVRRLLGAAVFVGASGLPFLPAAQAQQGRTVMDGVHTREQATRGMALFKDQCAACHGAALEGLQGPPLVGTEFMRVWGGPLSELVSKIQHTMPANDPGKLTRQDSTDLVAYMLQVGKFPAGQTELSTDEKVLSQITFPPVPPSRQPLTVTTTNPPSFPAAGNMAQLMRAILFPSSNLIFTVQSRDPATPLPKPSPDQSSGGFSWSDWGAGIYTGWELVDYAAVALAESAPLMLTPGRRCENGKRVPVEDADWIKFTLELAEAGRAAYKASQTRSQEAVSAVTDQVATSCSNCHRAYRDKPGKRTTVDPSNKAARCVP
jgi:mono/diheme cytochrome c family protein